MTGMDWDRVHFEHLIAKQGSEWMRQEFHHHGDFELGSGPNPRVCCKHCKEKFPLNALEKHVRRMHQFVVIKRSVGEKEMKILRRPLKKRLIETRVGRDLMSKTKSPKKKLKKKHQSLKANAKPIDSVTPSLPRNSYRLLMSIRELVPKKKF